MSQPGKKSSTPSRIAMVEDEDETTGEPIPDTRREAKQKPSLTSSTQGVRPRSPSDSGYSSFDNRSQNATSSSAAGISSAPAVLPPEDAAAAATRRPATTASSKGSKKPVVVQPSRPETSRNDLPRRDSTYESNPERKYTLPERDRFAQAQSRGQYPAPPVQYPAAQVPPVSVPRTTPMAPPPVPSADPTRRRRSSTTSARPNSIHGYPSAAPLPGNRMSFDATIRGPPPSRSAFPEYGMPVHPQPYPMYYPPSTVYGTTPPSAAAPMYPVASPPIPTSPNYNSSFSARAGYSVPAYGGGAPYTSRPALGRTSSISARTPTVHPRESGRPQIQYHASHEQALVDNDYFVSPPLLRVDHRPALGTHLSTGDVPHGLVRRESRRQSRSAEQSEVGSDYPAPRDRYAIDLVERPLSARPVSSRRMSSYGVPSSRGDVSMHLNEDLIKVTLEDGHGHRVVYWTEKELHRFKEQAREEELADRQVQERLLNVERKSRQIDNYVRANGTTSQDLTAEALQMRQIEQGVPSHSSRRSHRSKASGSRIEQGIVIRHAEAGASLHVSGDVHVEMRQPENGGLAEFVVTSGSGMDNSYYSSSRGSRSATDRSRNSGENARRRHYDDYNLHDSNGYERGM